MTRDQIIDEAVRRCRCIWYPSPYPDGRRFKVTRFYEWMIREEITRLHARQHMGIQTAK